MIAVSGEPSGIRAALVRLERPLSDEHFILEDATGRVFPIQLKIITSWEALEFIIADRFKGKKGANPIRRNRYSLQERATQREIIRSTDWESAFLPYQRVDMSLLCTEPKRDRSESILKLSFLVVEVDDERGLPDKPSAPTVLSPPFGESTSIDEDSDGEEKCTPSQESESDSDDEDIRGFMRIRVIFRRRGTKESELPFGITRAESSEMNERFASNYPAGGNLGSTPPDNTQPEPAKPNKLNTLQLTHSCHFNEHMTESDALEALSIVYVVVYEYGIEFDNKGYLVSRSWEQVFRTKSRNLPKGQFARVVYRLNDKG
ncbi:hypothetical protein CI238_06673 [Colletotrichum incanum]|uniref:Ubiquitin-like domain-containing protein n=1 Tax=Colletotrichum incanum TaxID=1573173 RepID=A0A167B626_COLIC|nr:hypothetical protein CI238_06673 [Colletotrichum incanum]